jgi:hypothetical protein
MLRRLQEMKPDPRTVPPSPVLVEVLANPTRILTRAGMLPDPWQADLLMKDYRRALLLCSRQAGKSLVSAALALKAALTEPGSLTLLLSPTLRQSGELYLKYLDLYRKLGRPVPTVRPRDNALKLELVNGSRIVALPGVEATVRSFSSVRLLVIDEAARVSDDLYYSIRPMLAVSGGALIAVSSAYAKQGFFFREWTGSGPWHRVHITASQCPRISPEFLEEERQALGERWFLMEYFGVFGDAIDSVFREEDINAAFRDDVPPLFEDVP